MTALSAVQGAMLAREDSKEGFNTLPVCIVVLCILFNFILCFVNTRITLIAPSIVIGSELLLISVSFGIGFYSAGRERLYWIVIIFLELALVIFLSMARQELMLKPLRDLLIMPVFVALGLSAGRARLTRPLFLLSLLITVFGLFETFFLDDYLSFFNIRHYFIAKGAQDDFSFTKSDLFVSGVRPGGRFLLDWPSLHRVSSVFLEPVSLGFYGFIAALYFIAMKRHMKKRVYYAAILLSLLLIWLSDARMALGVLIITLLLRPVFARLDHRLCLLVFPAFFALCLLIYTTEGGHFTGEGFGTRIGEFFDGLFRTDENILFGLSHYDPPSVNPAKRVTVDSGLLYLVENVSVFGLLLFWLSPILCRKSLSPEARIYLFGVTVFTSCCFVITAAIFTIKTAALLWFQYGYIMSVTQAGPSQEILTRHWSKR